MTYSFLWPLWERFRLLPLVLCMLPSCLVPLWDLFYHPSPTLWLMTWLLVRPHVCPIFSLLAIILLSPLCMAVSAWLLGYFLRGFEWDSWTILVELPCVFLGHWSELCTLHFLCQSLWNRKEMFIFHSRLDSIIIIWFGTYFVFAWSIKGYIDLHKIVSEPSVARLVASFQSYRLKIGVTAIEACVWCAIEE